MSFDYSQYVLTERWIHQKKPHTFTAVKNVTFNILLSPAVETPHDVI